jgi:Ca2+-binding RTX toxin-like protein
MAKSTILDQDTFAHGAPAIVFTESDETWTVAKDTIASSSDKSGVSSDQAASSLFNFGTILSAKENGDGVGLAGANSRVSNAAGAMIIGAGSGLTVSGDKARIDNQGAIQGLSKFGVEFAVTSDHVTLDNGGSIFGRNVGIKAFSDFDGGSIHNTGLISSDDLAIWIQTNVGLTTFIDNAVGGTIRGGGGDALFVSFGRIVLHNHGAMVGDIEADADIATPDVIINHGKIKGEVLLAAGNDVFTGTGGTSGDVFGGSGNDRLTGGSAPDKLYGETGNDLVIGAGGNDAIDGGFGLDTLTGGAGRDRFIFQSELNALQNVDRITDFTVAIDKIVIDADVFAGVGRAGALAAAHFHVGAAAHDANDRIIYNPNNGFLIYDANGNRPGGAVHFATLASHLALTHSDFVVTELLNA